MPTDAEVAAAAGALSTVGWFSSKAADRLARVALEAAEAVREAVAVEERRRYADTLRAAQRSYRCGVCLYPPIASIISDAITLDVLMGATDGKTCNLVTFR